MMAIKMLDVFKILTANSVITTISQRYIVKVNEKVSLNKLLTSNYYSLLTKLSTIRKITGTI
jgi:hypothetical protein